MQWTDLSAQRGALPRWGAVITTLEIEGDPRIGSAADSGALHGTNLKIKSGWRLRVGVDPEGIGRP